MANFCLPKDLTQKFLNALKDGTIDPAKLIDMTSAERRDFFAKIVGEDNAREVNAQLESKLLLKDQKRGMVAWAKKLSGITEKTRTDLVSKIDRMDNVLTAKDEDHFLEDLAAKKLGTDVTFDEAKQITEGSKIVQDLKSKIPADAANGSKEVLDYGNALVAFTNYIKELKGSESLPAFKDFLEHPSKILTEIGGTTKSILASFDNSYFGRQGIKTLYTNPDIWVKNFAKSWVDIAKEVTRGGAMEAIQADVWSRKLAREGDYHDIGLDVGLDSEEAFPKTYATYLLEHTPILGRLFKASEAAFNGGALRMRADLADRIIPKAKEFGVNLKEGNQGKGIGQLINSLTGRGKISGLTPGGQDVVNAGFFSLKYLKSNFDALTAHRAGFAIEKGPARAFVRRQAAMNLVKIIGTVGTIMTIANLLSPGSAETDPRNSNFGKIKIGKNHFDITGGMGSIVVLASKLVMQSSKSSVTGKITPLNSGKFGSQTELDTVVDFFTGKASPFFGVALDKLKGEDYNGDKIDFNLPSAAIEGQNLITPLPLQTYQSLQSPNAATTLGLMILDGLGFSVISQTPPKKKK